MVLVLFSITAVSAFLVALVNDVTKDTIAKTEQENKDKAKLEVLPKAKGVVTYEELTREIGDFKVVVTKVLDNGELLGYAVEAPSITKAGYADRIYLMVGFVEDEAGDAVIHGVKVLSQKETPGLGAEMIKPGNKLEKSILNKSADELTFEVKKDNANGSFDALTGSTISSRAYTNAVETAYAGYLWATGQLTENNDNKPAQEEDIINEDVEGATTDEVLDDDESDEVVSVVDESIPAEVNETKIATPEGVEQPDEDADQPVVVEDIEYKEEPEAQEGDKINE